MARPRRKHTSLPGFASTEAQAMIANIAKVIGRFGYRAVERVGTVVVFRLDGPTGSGLLAESWSQLDGRPGVNVATFSAWVRGAGTDRAWILDGRFHSWDPGTAALATGDRTLLDGPKRRMYRVRDERTAEVARDDTLAVSSMPASAVPALMAGLTPEHARALAVAHAPELLAPPD